jgi:hypothetical protein
MRSCSLPVLVHETTEQVTSVDLGRRILATEGRFDSGIRRLQPERPVRTVGVVVLDIDPDRQDLLEVAAPDDQQPPWSCSPPSRSCSPSRGWSGSTGGTCRPRPSRAEEEGV